MLVILLAWACIVATGIHYHEFWRDEVRALSLALAADHIWNMHAVIQGEGHPIVWYLLLRAAFDLFGTQQIMPLVSVLVAAGALLIFLARAPFPLWWKVLFVFCGLPLYEYVVMARNYGISMLLMFAFAAAFSGSRRSPVVLGAILFLLAQTNVHSALFVPALALVWFCRWVSERGNTPATAAGMGELALGMALAAAGLLCAFLTVYPSPHTLIVNDLAQQTYARGSYLRAIGLAVLEPGFFYRKITLLPWLPGTILLYAAALGLARRRALLAAALLGLWASSAFFALVYNSGYRHQGLWLIFLMALYWIALCAPAGSASAQASRGLARAFSFSLYFVLPLLFALNWVAGYRLLETDLRFELSKSRALGAALHADASLRDALIVSQPDEYIESIPYYAGNPTYLLREGTAGNAATWSRGFTKARRLGDVLRDSQALKAKTGRPVVIIMAHRLADDGVDSVFGEDYGNSFAYSARELLEFRGATEKLAIGPEAVREYRENFDAYVLR